MVFIELNRTNKILIIFFFAGAIAALGVYYRVDANIFRLLALSSVVYTYHKTTRKQNAAKLAAGIPVYDRMWKYIWRGMFRAPTKLALKKDAVILGIFCTIFVILLSVPNPSILNPVPDREQLIELHGSVKYFNKNRYTFDTENGPFVLMCGYQLGKNYDPCLKGVTQNELVSISYWPEYKIILDARSLTRKITFVRYIQQKKRYDDERTYAQDVNSGKIKFYQRPLFEYVSVLFLVIIIISILFNHGLIYARLRKEEFDVEHREAT